MVDDVRNEHQCGEERKCLKEICRRLIHTVRQAVIAWAQRTTELDRKAPAFFELGATLIASLPADCPRTESIEDIVAFWTRGQPTAAAPPTS